MSYELEKELYEQSRSLKFQAREMRKKRIEKEEYDLALFRKKQKEQKEIDEALAKVRRAADEKAYKVELDARIQKVMFDFMASLKKNSLAFETAPTYGTVAPAFKIIDQTWGKGHCSTQIESVSGRGFQWK